MALSSRSRSTRGVVVLLVTASLITITLDYKEGRNGPLARIGSVAVTIITPLQNGVTKLVRPIGAFFSALAHLPTLEDENARLRAQLRGAAATKARNDALEGDLAEVEQLLDLRDTLASNLPTTGARVVGNRVSNFEWTIEIGKGSKDGIERDMAVIATDGLIGHVTQVGVDGSQVQLILDPQSSVASKLVESQQTGGLRGEGDGQPVLTLIGSSTDVSVGETVLTAGITLQGGEHSIYPPNIPIGTVAEVNEVPGGLRKEIVVQPNVDFTTLDYVLVVKATEP